MAIWVAVVFDKKFVLLQVLFSTENLKLDDWIIIRKEMLFITILHRVYFGLVCVIYDPHGRPAVRCWGSAGDTRCWAGGLMTQAAWRAVWNPPVCALRGTSAKGSAMRWLTKVFTGKSKSTDEKRRKKSESIVI